MKNILRNLKEDTLEMFRVLRTDAAVMVAWLKSILLPQSTRRLIDVLDEWEVDSRYHEWECEHDDELISGDVVFYIPDCSNEELELNLKHQGFKK